MSIITDISIVQPKIISIRLTQTENPSVITTQYVSNLETGNVSALSSFDVNTTYRGDISQQGVSTINELIFANPFVDTQYISQLTPDVTVGSILPVINTSYNIQAGFINVGASSTNVVIDTKAPVFADAPDLVTENVHAGGFDVVLQAYPIDEQVPLSALRFGLVVEENILDWVDATEQGPDYGNFREIKTGAELIADGDKFTFNGAAEDTFYNITVIVWDDNDNFSSYNILEDTTPVLNITAFYINEDLLVLDINETGSLTVTIEGSGFSNNVQWESLSPGIAESLGGGEFLGLTTGQTGARATVNGVQSSNTVAINVADYSTTNPGEESSFTTGASGVVDTSYESSLTPGSVTATVDDDVIVSTSYQSTLDFANVAANSFEFGLNDQNAVLIPYELQSGQPDDVTITKYNSVGIVTTSYQTDIDIDSVATSQSVIPLVIDTSYDGSVETTGPETTQVIFPAEVTTTYAGAVDAVSPSVDATVELINLSVTTTYAGNVSTGIIGVDGLIIPLIVDASYQGNVSAGSVIVQSTLSLINPNVDASYSSGVSPSNAVVESELDLDGPIANNYNLNIFAQSGGIWEIELEALASDETTPDANIGYGLLILPITSGGQISQANTEGRDFSNYIETKTGAELLSDDNKFTFVDPASLAQNTEHYVTIITWDQFNNTSQYNILFVTPASILVDSQYSSAVNTSNVQASAIVQAI